MKGKNKLVPRLLGVTKESILRVDEKTKEVGAHLGLDHFHERIFRVRGGSFGTAKNMSRNARQSSSCLL